MKRITKMWIGIMITITSPLAYLTYGKNTPIISTIEFIILMIAGYIITSSNLSISSQDKLEKI